MPPRRQLLSKFAVLMTAVFLRCIRRAPIALLLRCVMFAVTKAIIEVRFTVLLIIFSSMGGRPRHNHCRRGAAM